VSGDVLQRFAGCAADHEILKLFESIGRNFVVIVRNQKCAIASEGMGKEQSGFEPRLTNTTFSQAICGNGDGLRD
jgi:hypothetical protein